MARSAVGTSTMLVSRTSTVTAAISPITPAATPKQERPQSLVVRDADQLPMQEDRKDESRDEDAQRHDQRADQAPGYIADEGREDDQGRREHAAHRQAVDELAIGQPMVSIDGRIVRNGITVKAPPNVTSPAFRPTQKISAVSESVIAPARKSTAGIPTEND